MEVVGRCRLELQEPELRLIRAIIRSNLKKEKLYGV